MTDDWHAHIIGPGDLPNFIHRHPDDVDDHDHAGYTLLGGVGQATRLMKDGRRLEGEVTPIETLRAEGASFWDQTAP